MVDDTEFRRLARMHRRARSNGTNNPFCCVCGGHHWTVRYDLHHFAERKYDPRTIRLCRGCHEKVTDMQKDYPRIPEGTEARLAKMIAMVRGLIIQLELTMQVLNELHSWLTGPPEFPALSDKREKTDDE